MEPHDSAGTDARPQLRKSRSSRHPTLLDVRKAEQVSPNPSLADTECGVRLVEEQSREPTNAAVQDGSKETYGMDGVLQRPQPAPSPFTTAAAPAALPFIYAGDSKHDAIAAAAARTITSIKAALQRQFSGHEDALPDVSEVQTASNSATKLNRPSEQVQPASVQLEQNF